MPNKEMLLLPINLEVILVVVMWVDATNSVPKPDLAISDDSIVTNFRPFNLHAFTDFPCVDSDLVNISYN